MVFKDMRRRLKSQPLTSPCLKPGASARFLVTAPAWTAHPNWLAEFLTVLGTKIEHPELATVV